MTSCSIIQTMCDKKRIAQKISESLLRKKLAACVKIIPNVESSFWWEKKLENENEFLLQIITRKELVDKVKEIIKQNHSYELPEIVEFEIRSSSPEYLKWIEEVTR